MAVDACRMLVESLIPCGVAGVFPSYVMDAVAMIGGHECVSTH